MDPAHEACQGNLEFLLRQEVIPLKEIHQAGAVLLLWMGVGVGTFMVSECRLLLADDENPENHPPPRIVTMRRSHRLAWETQGMDAKLTLK